MAHGSAPQYIKNTAKSKIYEFSKEIPETRDKVKPGRDSVFNPCRILADTQIKVSVMLRLVRT